MNLINFLKTNFLLPNFLSWFVMKIPAFAEHNLGKYWAIKKAFYLTALEQLEGNYFEFGVFTGSSFVCALRAHRSFQFLGKLNTKFYGFDSFSGFGKVSEHDKHPFYTDNTFAVNEARVVQNIKRKAGDIPTTIVSGYFEDTLTKGVAGGKSRVVLIDCDLKEPAKLCLEYITGTLQQGTILIMDDFFSYKGDESKGVAGAFSDHRAKYPNIKWRKIYDYGYGGVAYIVSKVETTNQ